MANLCIHSSRDINITLWIKFRSAQSFILRLNQYKISGPKEGRNNSFYDYVSPFVTLKNAVLTRSLWRVRHFVLYFCFSIIHRFKQTFPLLFTSNRSLDYAVLTQAVGYSEDFIYSCLCGVSLTTSVIKNFRKVVLLFN